MEESKAPLILTIDDETAIRSSFRNFLEDLDYEVLEAENGRTGLEIFKKEKPDLLLLDLRMPEVDGLEVLAHVNANSPETPVIVISGTGVMSEAVEALHLGAWDYLFKPIEDMTVLQHAVEKCLERARLLRENRVYQEHLEEEVTIRTRQLQKANEALRASEENLSITLDSIGDAVIVVSPEGRVTRMNPVAEKLTGWSLAEAKKNHISAVFNIINVNSKEPVENPLNRVLKKGQIVDLEKDTLLIARDNTRRRISNSGAPIRSKEGSIIGMVLVFRDITEQHKLEEQLRQSQKMDAIGQLAGGVAHDFNNMLGGIIGAADLLSLKFANDKKLMKYTTIIQDAAKRASDLTRKLLDFSRIGKNTSTPVDIHQLVKETIRLLERSIDRRINLKENLAAEISIIKGDPSQLQNALLNLGINARDAMPDGGTITISTTNVTLDDQYCRTTATQIPPGFYIEISVTDTGTGIPNDIQERIFEPFFTTKGTGKGTGLGLTAVYSMIRNHQGSVHVYSQLEKGTAFKLYLPVERGVEVSPPGEKKDEDIQGTGCILLVDDERIVRTMVEELLVNLGYSVIYAEDGAAGVELYRKEKDNINLVLLDMVMPRMNGRDAFFAMRAINPEIKVLLTSGFSRDIEIADLVKEEGVCGFIQKPFRRIELGKRIKQALSCPRASHENVDGKQ